jgi:hypothetical protein
MCLNLPKNFLNLIPFSYVLIDIFFYTGTSGTLLLIYQYMRRKIPYYRSADSNKTEDFKSLLKNAAKREIFTFS